MKLTDLIADLEKKNYITTDGGFLVGTELKSTENQLFECEEFKNVARINFISLPTYFVDEETGEPIATNREFLGGKTIAKQVSSFIVKAGQEIKFNKIVDLYSIQLRRRFSLKEEISKPGIWVYPTVYNMETLDNPINQIRVIWDPSQLDQALKMVGTTETPKERLLRMFETALESMEPNIPCEYELLIRCSVRSVLNSDETMVIETPPVQIEPTVINVDIPSIS